MILDFWTNNRGFYFLCGLDTVWFYGQCDKGC